MRFKDIEEKNNQINFIREAYTGQFTIGFELEGICTWKKDDENSPFIFHLPSYGHYDEENDHAGGTAWDLKMWLDDIFSIEGDSGLSKIEKDGSLNTNGFSHLDYEDVWNFEYATKKIPFNAKNLEKIYYGLTRLGENGVFTNNSCGFHIHMSFPDISKEDIIWILCCIACNDKLVNDMLFLDKNGEEIKLFNYEYATTDFLDEIKENIDKEDWSELNTIFTNTKYRVLHIDEEHKTIEWRGPRGFLNDDDADTIKAFILKWFRLISSIAKITQSTSYESDIGTLNKYDLLKEIKADNLTFVSDKEENKKKKSKKFINDILNAPVKIFSLSPKTIEHIYKADPYQIHKTLRELFKNDMFEEEWVYSKPDFIETVYDIFLKEGHSNKPLITFEFCHQLYVYYTLNNENFLQTMPSNIKKDLISGLSKLILTDVIFHHGEFEFIKKINDEYNLFNTPEMKKVIKSLYNKKDEIDFEKISYISDNLPGYIWNILMDNRYVWNIHYFKVIPEKYQIRLVQKNPYNLQYINNPCEKAIKLAEKTVPNIKDYI